MYTDDSIASILAALPSGYPEITEDPALKAVEKDRNTVLICNAQGYPEPTVTWVKDYIPVDMSDPRLTLLSSGKYLLIFTSRAVFRYNTSKFRIHFLVAT